MPVPALEGSALPREVAKVLESRVEGVKAELEKQPAGVAKEWEFLTARLASIQIDQTLVTEATKRGLRAAALPEVTSRARNTSRLVNGLCQALEADTRPVSRGAERSGSSP